VSGGAGPAGISATGGPADTRRYRRNDPETRNLPMKWETPVAIDLRFGMEITMYVANR
jgi:coenzyme PQQ precursor peptide PqqA